MADGMYTSAAEFGRRLKLKRRPFQFLLAYPAFATVTLLLAGLGFSIVRQATLSPLIMLFTATMFVLHAMLFMLVIDDQTNPYSHSCNLKHMK